MSSREISMLHYIGCTFWNSFSDVEKRRQCSEGTTIPWDLSYQICSSEMLTDYIVIQISWWLTSNHMVSRAINNQFDLCNLVQRTQEIMTPFVKLWHHLSNLSFFALKTMQLLLQIILNWLKLINIICNSNDELFLQKIFIYSFLNHCNFYYFPCFVVRNFLSLLDLFFSFVVRYFFPHETFSFPMRLFLTVWYFFLLCKNFFYWKFYPRRKFSWKIENFQPDKKDLANYVAYI